MDYNSVIPVALVGQSHEVFNMTDLVSNKVARCVITEFTKLPPSRKPIVRTNGVHEWVPCSGIVAQIGNQFICICLGTGMKCLPTIKLPKARGTAIHDWHAEIVTLRALNLYLQTECEKSMKPCYTSNIVQRSDNGIQPFKIKDGIVFHMYCSEAPCGDCSMELVMQAQDDAAPWTRDPNPTYEQTTNTLLGREGFNNLGTIRRKPSRSDALISLSKSCSDKIAIRQCSSFLSWSTTLLISPENAYLKSLVLPHAQYSKSGLERCFSRGGRMKDVADMTWDGGYSYHELEFHATDIEFPYSRRVLEAKAYQIAPCNMSVTWIASGFEERTLGGFLLGKKPFDVKAASILSRRKVLERIIAITGKIGGSLDKTHIDLSCASYSDAKKIFMLQNRRWVIQDTKVMSLKGWIRNEGDNFFLEDRANNM